MKQRNKWILATVILIIGLAAIAVVSMPREPKHNGRPLREWLNDLESPKHETKQAAEEAIRAMGSKAVPFLTQSLEQRNSATLRLYRNNAMAQKWLRGLRQRLKWHQPVMESRNAARALSALGPEANAAIPNLVAALNDTSSLVAQEAAGALGTIGSAAVPLLIERLRVAPTNDTTWVFQALMKMGPAAKEAAPEASKLVTNRTVLGDFAVMALARMGPSAIPLMTNYLSASNVALRVRASSYFMQLGANSIFATNVLMEAARDSDATVRGQVLQALGNTREKELMRPVWLASFKDSASKNVLIALNHLGIDESGVRAHSNEIAALLNHQEPAVRMMASNLLTAYQVWHRVGGEE